MQATVRNDKTNSWKNTGKNKTKRKRTDNKRQKGITASKTMQHHMSDNI
jgi:hypothetical protein